MDEFPVDLKLATWEKKKGALPAKHAIAETLKGLQRKHDAVDWKAYAPGTHRVELVVDFPARPGAFAKNGLLLPVRGAGVKPGEAVGAASVQNTSACATPKSATRAWPSESRMFSGLISRCTTPCRWA